MYIYISIIFFFAGVDLSLKFLWCFGSTDWCQWVRCLLMVSQIFTMFSCLYDWIQLVCFLTVRYNLCSCMFSQQHRLYQSVGNSPFLAKRFQDQKDEQMMRIRAQMGYQHDPGLEKIQKKIRQTPFPGCLKELWSIAMVHSKFSLLNLHLHDFTYLRFNFCNLAITLWIFNIAMV